MSTVCALNLNYLVFPFSPSSGAEWYLIRVELTVTDVNDNVPEWNMVPTPYLAVVSPDASAGSLVYKLLAVDGDEGNNGEVEYFLSDGRCFSNMPLRFRYEPGMYNASES